MIPESTTRGVGQYDRKDKETNKRWVIRLDINLGKWLNLIRALEEMTSSQSRGGKSEVFTHQVSFCHCWSIYLPFQLALCKEQVCPPHTHTQATPKPSAESQIFTVSNLQGLDMCRRDLGGTWATSVSFLIKLGRV